MTRIWMYIFAFLGFGGAVVNALPKEDQGLVSTLETCIVSSYLRDLEELGYCIIPQTLSTAETEILYQRVWHEFIEKAWPDCKLDDRSNWKEAFPMHNLLGIFSGPAGQTQVMWDLRQDPRIVEIFAKIWSTNELIVSMDGLSVMCPPEIREGYSEPWPHVDQAIMRRQDNFTHSNNPPEGFVSESLLKTKPYTIQGQFLFEDSSEEDGGFYCIPKSHLKFSEFAPQLEEIDSQDVSKEERTKKRYEYIQNFFNENYERKHITAPKGSLILWDSRTIHWNQHPSKERAFRINPRVRMVGYISYVPKARLTNDGRSLRKEAFENGISTGHNPANPQLKDTKNHIRPEFVRYLEDPSYIHPQINLTPLGKSLLGV